MFSSARLSRISYQPTVKSRLAKAKHEIIVLILDELNFLSAIRTVVYYASLELDSPLLKGSVFTRFQYTTKHTVQVHITTGFVIS